MSFTGSLLCAWFDINCDEVSYFAALFTKFFLFLFLTVYLNVLLLYLF